MKDIKELLSKFQKIFQKEEIKRLYIIDVIKTHTNINISTKDIKIKDNIIYLNIKPIFKNQILLKKDLILKDLKTYFPNKEPKIF